eukprot:1067829-Prymnesium_polylepis.2
MADCMADTARRAPICALSAPHQTGRGAVEGRLRDTARDLRSLVPLRKLFERTLERLVSSGRQRRGALRAPLHRVEEAGGARPLALLASVLAHHSRCLERVAPGWEDHVGAQQLVEHHELACQVGVVVRTREDGHKAVAQQCEEVRQP